MAQVRRKREGESLRKVPLAERPALRRARLISAAVAVYGEAGFRSATVRAICRRARLTERYFYESFGSSEDLLIEAAHTLAFDTLAWMKQRRDAVDGDRDLKTAHMLRGYFRQQSDQRSQARLFTLEFRGISPAADAEFDRILDAFADLIVETRDPALRGPAAHDRLLRRGIVAGVLQVTVAWIEGGYRESLAGVVAAALRICCVADD
jgi:AcrR family transcriptional regulator